MRFGVIYEDRQKQRRVEFSEYPNINTNILTPGQYNLCYSLAEQSIHPGERIIQARAIKDSRDEKYFLRILEDGIIR